MTTLPKTHTPTPPYLRVILLILGTVFLGIGIIGIPVPVLPTTPFLLVAAACYARSSEKLYNWLLTNRWFGKYISDYLNKKGIPLRAKVIAIGLLWLTIGLSAAFALDSLIARILLVVVAIGVTWHLVAVKTSR